MQSARGGGGDRNNERRWVDLVLSLLMASKSQSSPKISDILITNGPSDSLYFSTADSGSFAEKALKERCPPRQTSRVELLKRKVEPLLTYMTVENTPALSLSISSYPCGDPGLLDITHTCIYTDMYLYSFCMYIHMNMNI